MEQEYYHAAAGGGRNVEEALRAVDGGFNARIRAAFAAPEVVRDAPYADPWSVSLALETLDARINAATDDRQRRRVVRGFSDNAASQGNLAELAAGMMRGYQPSWDTIRLAARNGHLEVLAWLRVQDPPCPWNQGGYLEVLAWLRALDPPCPRDASTCAEAAREGGLTDPKDPGLE